MKICFLADAAHVNTINWVTYFANTLNHEVHVISFNLPIGKKSKVIFHHLKSIIPKSKLRYLLSIQKAKEIIKDINPDILVGYRVTSYGFLAAATGFQPLILAGQGQFIVWPPYNFFKKLFAKYAIKKSSLINCWGNHMAKQFSKLGADPKKILICPKGVDTKIFRLSNFETKYNVSEKVTLITTRALRKDYSIDIIIKALKTITQNGSNNFHLSIVGEGKYKDDLVRLAKRLKIENYITFHGHVEYSELPGYLNNSLIYVSTVGSDGVSSSLLEAMACGVFPIIVNNEANRQWIQDSVNGFLYEPNDYLMLSEKILKALKNPSLVRNSVNINLDIIEKKATLDRNMKTFEHAYNLILKKSDCR